MNPKAKQFKVQKCVVCDYPFSDTHHLYPQIHGGEKTIFLCPNHHRYANMLQVIAMNSGDDGFRVAREFAIKHFDKDFNDKVLELLISAHAYGVFYVGFMGAYGSI